MAKPPILYSFRRCPYAMRARMAIAVSGVQTRLREVLLRDKPQSMLDASPKGTVPVLVRDDGGVIDESIDVMDWALAQNDPQGWREHRDDVLIAANDGPFKQALDHYKYPTRYDLDDIQEPRAKGLEYLMEIDRRLDGKPYLAGSAPGYTDIAIFPFVRQFSMVDSKWFAEQALTNLKPWLARLLESELFQSIMHKYPQWREGEQEADFPEAA